MSLTAMTSERRQPVLLDGLTFEAFRFQPAREAGVKTTATGAVDPVGQDINALHATVYGVAPDALARQYWSKRLNDLGGLDRVAAEMLFGRDKVSALASMIATRNSDHLFRRNALAIDEAIQAAFNDYAGRAPTTKEVLSYYLLVLNNGFGCADVRFRIWVVFQKKPWTKAPFHVLAPKLFSILIKRYAPPLSRLCQPPRAQRALLEDRIAEWHMFAIITETIANQLSNHGKGATKAGAGGDHAA